MKRLLVVHQYKGSGSGQDQQRGRMYEPVMRAHGYEPRFIGRKVPFAPRLSRRSARWARTVRRSLPYKGGYWLLERGARTLTDFRIKRLARRHDAVLFIKTDSARLVRDVRKRSRARLVYDFADALWMPQHGIGKDDLQAILQTVDAVTCDNPYTASYVRTANPTVFIWPSASHIEFFDALPEDTHRDRHKTIIGWIGSHGTAPSLLPLLDALRSITQARADVEVRLVGYPSELEWNRRLQGIRCTTVPMYDREDMIREVSRMDIGLFPMTEGDDARARGVTKALIYMAGGAVVAASPAGGAPQLITDDVDGILVPPDRWHDRLLALVDDPERRRAIARRARDRMRAGYTLERCFAALRPALDATRASVPSRAPTSLTAAPRSQEIQ